MSNAALKAMIQTKNYYRASGCYEQ